jgi:hypothetical protein
MSSEYIILQDIPHAETQEWAAAVETPTRKLTLSLAKPETSYPDSGFLTPSAVSNFTDQQVKVFVQFGFGNHNPFSDTEYADAGAEFSHHYADLTMLSNLIFKFDAFTADQIALSKESQILVSILPPTEISQAYIEAVNEKKITLLCLDLLRDDNGCSVTENIRKATLSEAGFQIALSNFVFPLADTIIHAPSIPYALQRAPELMSSVLCHAGTLCHQPTAERLQLPWRDIISLCWDLN